MKSMMLVIVLTAGAAAASTRCEEAEEVGSLRVPTSPRDPPWEGVDIFDMDPYSLAHEVSWRYIAETLAMRYSCGLIPDIGEPWTRKPKDLHRALVAAGDRCAAEREAVIDQLVAKSIKQGVEASWTPTRKLWKCEQRVAMRRG